MDTRGLLAGEKVELAGKPEGLSCADCMLLVLEVQASKGSPLAMGLARIKELGHRVLQGQLEEECPS